MSGYDTASTESLKQRLADTEETLTALRKSQAREQERYDRTKALLQAEPTSPEAPAWLKEYQDADANLWWYQEQVEHFETRRDMCLAALRKK